MLNQLNKYFMVVLLSKSLATLLLCCLISLHGAASAALLASGTLGQNIVNLNNVENSGYFFAITDRPITSYFYVFQENNISIGTQIHSLTSSDGNIFNETVGFLTNGQLDYLHTQETFIGSSRNSPESSFFFGDFSGNSGIDLIGASIQEVRLNTVIALSEFYPNALSLDYTLEVYGAYVPIPPALWLFGSGLIGLIGLARLASPHHCTSSNVRVFN